MTTTAAETSPPGGTRRERFSLLERWSQYGRPPRVIGVDVARALAVIGMIGVHAGISMGSEGEGAITWTSLVEGRSSILFALVAGISVAMATGFARRPEGEELRSARLRLAGRAIAVLAVGLLLELLGSGIAVILPVYGVLFLLVIPFVGLRRSTLFMTAGALALVGPTLVALVTLATRGTTGAGVQFLITGSYPLSVWLPLVLAGIAIGRCELRGRVLTLLIGVGAALTVAGYGIGSALTGTVDAWLTGFGAFSGSFADSAAASGAAPSFSGGSTGEQFSTIAARDLPSALAQAWAVGPHSAGTFEIIGSGGFALLIVGLCVLAGRHLRALLVPLAAVGSMPLTAYAAHVVSFAILASPLALAPESAAAGGAASGMTFWLVCIASLLVGCTAWALTLGRGPLERVTAWAARRVDAAPAPSRAHG